MKRTRNILFAFLAVFIINFFTNCGTTSINVANENYKLYYIPDRFYNGTYYTHLPSKDYFVEGLSSRGNHDNWNNLGITYILKLSKNINPEKETQLPKEIRKKKEGEAIQLNKDNTIYYFVYDKESKKFLQYTFVLKANSKNIEEINELYKGFDKARSDICGEIYNDGDAISVTKYKIEELNASIENCNKVINWCSKETIQKSRTVEIPYTYTERVWIAGTTGRRTNSSFGSSEGTPGHYETRTYTAYKKQTEYYTVANPDYSPQRVAQARRDIQNFNGQINKLNEKMWQLQQDLQNATSEYYELYEEADEMELELIQEGTVPFYIEILK